MFLYEKIMQKHVAYAQQAADNYIGYTQGRNNSAEHLQHKCSADDTNRYVRQRHCAETAAEFAHDSQNTDDHESRRTGKSLGKMTMLKVITR